MNKSQTIDCPCTLFLKLTKKNTTLIVRNMSDITCKIIIIISLVKKNISLGTQGRSVESKQKRNPYKSIQGRAREPLECFSGRTSFRTYSNVSKKRLYLIRVQHDSKN